MVEYLDSCTIAPLTPAALPAELDEQKTQLRRLEGQLRQHMSTLQTAYRHALSDAQPCFAACTAVTPRMAQESRIEAAHRRLEKISELLGWTERALSAVQEKSVKLEHRALMTAMETVYPAMLNKPNSQSFRNPTHELLAAFVI